MTTRNVEHTIDIEAPAADVYAVIADVRNWPRAFPWTVYVDHVEQAPMNERIRIWAATDGAAKTWTSSRELDPKRLRVSFQQDTPPFPFDLMAGSWTILPLSENSSRAVLTHEFRALHGDPDELTTIDRAVEQHSDATLTALKTATEFARTNPDLVLSFTDRIQVNAAARDMYDFVNEANLWRERLPHVTAVEMSEDIPGLQIVRAETLTMEGDRHTTRTVRVCFPHHLIVYKQTTLPDLLAWHTGRWRFDEDTRGITAASAQHTVIIRRDRIEDQLGGAATVTDARTFVRDALGTASRATLHHALTYAKARR